MLSLVWVAEQLESEPPLILEEYQGYEIIAELLDSTPYATKYQIWDEFTRILNTTPLLDRGSVVSYIKTKFNSL
jgi:hypothetical protein